MNSQDSRSQRRAARHHKIAVVLYRRNRGDRVSAIAKDQGCSTAWVYQQLQRAHASVDIQKSAAMMAASSEDQMSFDFDA